ncbi:MAG: ABC transporter permease [Halobacteriales archaeon]
MKTTSAVAMAWRAIRGHKLRSTLTTIGVVIGVAAVITFVTLGASLSAAIVGDVGGSQAATMNVWAAPESADGQGGPGFGAQPVFTQHDVEQLRGLEDVEAVTPYGQVPTSAVTYGNDTVAKSSIVATAPDYLTTVSEPEFRAGENFEQGKREVVLNDAAATDMFDEEVAVGDNVTVTLASGDRMEATVVGVLNTSEGLSAFGGFGASPQVYAPTDPFYQSKVTAPSSDRPQRVYSLLILSASGPGAIEDARSQTTGYLESDDADAAGLAPDDYGFEIQTNEQLLEQLQDIIDTLTSFVTGIAVLALVVGAIGIANIMLVSVTERTREIGIMKAVGARRSDVIKLFVIEAAILGVVGAALGTGLGVVVGWVATLDPFLGLPLRFPLEWFPIAIGVGILVGVVSGLYPAWRGARTDPIEALRHE